MSRILFIQNGEHDHPGLLTRVVEDAGLKMDVIHPWAGDPVPTIANGWRGIVVGGGYISVNDAETYPFLRDEMRLIRGMRPTDCPLLGLCLGSQLMAVALGGEVTPNHEKEIGFYDVTLAPEANDDPIWRDLPEVINPVHWHEDVFSLPPGAKRLASSELTPNQLMRIGSNMYGVQFHLEIDFPVLKEMVDTDGGWLVEHGVDPDEFLDDAAHQIPKLEPLARTILTRWIQTLK